MTDRTSILLASRPEGAATENNFRTRQDEVPEPGTGEFVVRVIWMSLDPYMRGRMDDAESYADPVEVGDVMEAGGVGEVVASNHDGFAAGDIVTGQFGWTTHAVSDGAMVRKVDAGAAPLSAHLGVLGMPGITAWTGLNTIMGIEAGQTIVVSAATGAVGGVACQLAKAAGLRVIGVAGGAEKCAYAVDTLGCDACVDHRAAGSAKDLSREIAEAAPDGVDRYFENVGGKTLAAVLPRMNVSGRIALCGMVAWYQGRNMDEAIPLPQVWGTILKKRLRVQGFIVSDHFDDFPAFLKEVTPMLREGSVVAKEDITEDLENAPKAFLDMLKGGNFGKTLVRVGPDP